MSRLLDWVSYDVEGPGIDDDDYVGRGFGIAFFGRWLIEIQWSRRAGEHRS